MVLNINNDAVVKLTNKLEKMHKSALPVAIRGAINKAAFDVKQNTMPKSANKAFTNRQPNFFKANSRVEMAKGFDVRAMRAVVGFVEGGLKGGRNYAVKDLVQQEEGGNIKGRSFVPMKDARVGGKGVVKPMARIALVTKSLINAQKVRSVKGRFKKQKFIRAAIKAKELNPDSAFMLGNVKNGSQTLFRVDDLHTSTRSQGSFGSRKLYIRLTPLYRVKKGRIAPVNRTEFMKRASFDSSLNIERFFVLEAQRQFDKLKK